jgi:hypothetical protein
MPDKEPKEIIDESVDEPDSKISNEKTNHKRLIITLSIVGLVILGLIIGGGAWVFNTVAERANLRNQPFAGTMSRGNVRPAFGYGRAVQTQVSSDNTVTTTVYTYQTGVVIAVNSNNIVIAGNGKQTTIQTNSSTTYANNQKPVVNDTVRVAGTTSSNTITATDIAVTD